MKNVVNEVENLIRENHNSFEQKPSERPKEALAQAYALSLMGDKMTDQKKEVMINSITTICDAWADMMQQELESTGPNCTSEWEIIAICHIEQLTKKYLDPIKLKRWAYWAIAYSDSQAKRPFYYTAYNHEINRCLGMFLCGEMYDRPDLKESALFLARQLTHFATPNGFWEEGPHHGPSMRYNYIMIHGLSWMFQLTKDQIIKKATENLIQFMTTFVYPDGSSVGAIDGRQTSIYSHTYFMTAGLELTEAGQGLFARHTEAYRNWQNQVDKLMILQDFFVISALIYYKRFNIPSPKNSKLLLDQDYTIESHSSFHDAIMQRKGDWVVTLCGQGSQIPKEAPSVFRLERQSKIEIWHKDLQFVIGGGHNKTGNPIPYTNVIVSSGFKDSDFNYGEIISTDKKSNHSMYFPRALQTFVKDNIPNIILYFAHATINFAWKLFQIKKYQLNGQSNNWEQKKLQFNYLSL